MENSNSEIIARLEREFTPPQAQALAFELEKNQRDQVKAGDFNELKEIVRGLGLAQRELVEAQKRTEVKVEELAEAQKRTEVKVEELAGAQTRTEEEIRKLTISVGTLRQNVGGIANTIGYMLENEAYRNLPKLLAAQHKINLSSRIIRQQIGAEEINFLAEGKRGKTPILIVGEAKSKLAPKHLTQLKRKVKEVAAHHPAAKNREIVPVMVVHFAREKELQTASQQGVIVVQSFEW